MMAPATPVPRALRSYHAQILKLCGSLCRDTADEYGTPHLYAVTSTQEREGTSTICLLIARELARHPERSVLLASTEELAKLTPEDLSRPELVWIRDPQDEVWRIVPKKGRDAASSRWETDLRFVRQVLDVLRQQFGVVILDTGALLSSHDVQRIGHLLDGVILVVQAGRSTKQQIEYALQLLAIAGGEFKGFVLNRRTYPIPDRIYRWFRS